MQVNAFGDMLFDSKQIQVYNLKTVEQPPDKPDQQEVLRAVCFYYLLSGKTMASITIESKKVKDLARRR